MMKHRLYLAALVAAVIVPASGDATAGHRQINTVTINATSRFAHGTLSDTYNSADFIQYIGCQTYAFAGGNAYAVCAAVDAAGTPASCSTSDAKLVSIATGIGADDWVRFAWDAGSSQCSQINVTHYSFTSPKR